MEAENVVEATNVADNNDTEIIIEETTVEIITGETEAQDETDEVITGTENEEAAETINEENPDKENQV